MSKCICIDGYRHSQSEHNLPGMGVLSGGNCNPPLTRRGWKQIRAVARGLQKKEITYTRVYSSPLERALLLAKALPRGAGVPVTVSNLLREQCWGDAEGLTWPQIEARRELIAYDQRFWSHPAGERIYLPRWPGGDADWDVGERMLRFISQVVREPTFGPVAFVTHDGCLVGLLLRIGKLSSEDYHTYWHDNCGGFTLRIDVQSISDPEDIDRLAAHIDLADRRRLRRR